MTKPKPPNQSKAAFARAAALTPTRRAEIASKAAQARWLRATHVGEVKLLDESLACFVLDDGRRVLSNRGMVSTLKMSEGGRGTIVNGSNNRLQRFAAGKIISQFLKPETINAIENPIMFRTPGEEGSEAHGYEAVVLVEICHAVLNARDAGALMTQQMDLARRCDLLVRGFSLVALVALIDEATGYQADRARDALAQILEAYVAKELASWSKTFPDDFYSEMCRLRGITVEHFTAARPPYFGHLTNDVVYERLAPGVRVELKQKNPRTETGHRRAKHHQWLTRTIGHPKLAIHLGKVIAFMQASSSWDEFVDRLDRFLPRFGDTIPMAFLAELPRAKRRLPDPEPDEGRVQPGGDQQPLF